MAKAVKKRNRRLKKTFRKTLGALFMISAIVVAAIPVDGLRAAIAPGLVVSVDMENCQIPHVDEKETIYTTGDGQYQFAYVSPNNSSTNNKVAVILGYSGSYLEGGALTIPDSLDAYLKYSDNLGTNSGYAAVGRNGSPLFYAAEEPEKDAAGNILYDSIPRVNEDGEPVLGEDGLQIIDEVMRTHIVYHPCYYEDRRHWEDLDVEDFYYHSGDNADGEPIYSKTTVSDVQRIQGAEVWYIGNQYLLAGTGQDAGTWTIGGDITDSSKGIFAGQGNIRTLTVGDKLSGIGNYAFYGCSGLNSIELGNGLDTIGNYAFANCINMSTVDLELYSRVDIIGDHAFYNCQALQSFSVPISVTAIGDFAFEECYSMQSIDLCGGGANVSLTTLGNEVFKNCANLQSITFPRTFTNVRNGVSEPVDISMFKGCTSLKYISTSNNLINFTDKANPDFNFAAFKNSLPASFYFEGLANSPVHQMATANYFAFSYLNQDLYEITVDEDGKKAVYRVNSSNQLVYSSVAGIENITLPSAIGPYGIAAIDSGTFQNNCTLKQITIPSSIVTIADGAFKGCHYLKDVIFAEPINVTNIGANAFKTQDVGYHSEGCPDNKLTGTPELRFIGEISSDSVPFQYAMNAKNNINAGTQQRTYITFLSGWPGHLQVQYNHNTQKAELTDYPTFNDIRQGTKYTTANYSYMTPEYEEAARLAVNKYLHPDDNQYGPMTDFETEIIDAALNIVLPDGIESVKEGLFASREANESSSVEKVITAYSLKEIPDNAFEACTNLVGIYLMGGTTTIGDYAFKDCTKLKDVYIPETTESLGLRPFIGCSILDHVNFQGSPYFTCDKSIIYSLDSAGNKYSVIEFLEGRDTGVVEAAELAGVTEIAEEAFCDTMVSSADFRESEILDVPRDAFAETPNLFSVYLPKSCETISADAFRDSNLQYLEVPGSVYYLDNDAFSGTTNKGGLTFYCEDDSNAHTYAVKNGIKTTSKPVEIEYTVTFWDYDGTLLDTQTVPAGQDAVAPEVPGRDGYVLAGWIPDYHGVQSDLQVTAQYDAEDPNAKKLTVTFLDHDDTVLKTVLVDPGANAEAPFDPKREGYTFVGWRPGVENIQEDTTIYAQYEKNDSTMSQLTVRFIDYDDTVIYTQKVNYGENAITPQDPKREGYTFTGWRPAITNITDDLDTFAQYEKNTDDDKNDGNDNNNDNDGNNNNGNNNGNNNNGGNNNGGNNNGGNGQTNTKVYNLTVQNGSGSGSYVAGSQPIIIANDPASGQEFSHWTIDPGETKIASKVLTATVITMPERDVTVTANYKKKSTATTTGTNGSVSGNNVTNKPNNSGTVNGGTTVVIDKNGLSNTGVVSATVNGSSDNFTIKISETTAASEAALRALMAEYGSDLDGIKYFPMDISLYDSTGKKKITDTTGLSVKITLPLPDSMITYAGNNKVAGVVNDKLDKLDVKFNTISGVACVTFTAEHFSPYVIYVDTNNLTAGVVSDDTPKTGDGIHPKWFLSVGLACIAMVLFLKKDKKATAKVAVKA